MYNFYPKNFVPPFGRTSKILLMMKLTTVMLFLAIMQVSATSLAQKITLSEKNTPIDVVFEKIHTQTGFDFSLPSDVLKVANRVTINVKNVELQNVLALIFKDQQLEYQVVDKSILVRLKKAPPASRQLSDTSKNIKISGKVVDSTGKPLYGASVLDLNLKTGVVTGIDGGYGLSAREGDMISISFVGYKPVIFKASGNLLFQSVALYAVSSKLEEVVVSNGYQTVKAERFVGSVSQLDSASYARRAGMDIIDRLDGTVPGVVFDHKNTAQTYPIQIRGVSTLGIVGISPSTAPLIILDNFPYSGDLSSINPNDVENITVLKDAAATSIWGVQSGNGVIVITTKKGKYNQPFRISLNSNVTVQEKPNVFYYPQMSTSDFVDVQEFLFNKGYYDTNLSDNTNYPQIPQVVAILAQERSGAISATDANSQINTLKGVDFRDQLNKYIYKDAVSQQQYVDFSGGNSAYNYQFSAGYNNSLNDIQGGKGINQYTITSNQSFRPIKNLEITAGVNYSQSVDRRYNLNLPVTYPYTQLADANGNHLAVSNGIRQSFADSAVNNGYLDWDYRPLDEIKLADNSTTTRFIRLNFGVSYKITNWMSAEIKYQYANQTTNSRDYYSPQTYFVRSLINDYTNLSQSGNPTLEYPIPDGGILDLEGQQSNSHDIRGQLNFNKSWYNKNVFTALIAGEISESQSSITTNERLYGYDDITGSYQQAVDYVNPFPIIIGGGMANVPVGDGYSDGFYNRIVSLLANASYTYNDRYTIYASARRDGSNIFGVNTNNKWKPLWSTGVSWDISKEDFYSNKWLPYLRIRASYGYSGNINNQLSGLPTINYAPGTISPTNLPYAQVGNAPNPDLRWEQVGTTNIGIDFSTPKNRISGSLDVFHKKSTDLISNVPFDPTSGVTTYAVNSASMAGNGFDFLLNSKNLTGDIKWNTSFALSYSKMIVTKLFNDGYAADYFIEYGLNPAVGKMAYGISSYRWAGLDPTNGDPIGYLNGQVSKDYVGIANSQIQDQVFNGSAIPLYSGYIGNSVSWKQFTLSANITYRLDYYFRKPTINYSALFGGKVQSSDFDLRWQRPGDEKITTVPSMIYPDNPARDEFYEYSQVNVLRADNIRLQDIRLQYDFHGTILKSLGIPGLQVYLYANNLNMILWRANKSHLDPDYTGGTDSGLLPTPKTLTAGININLK